RLWEILLGSLVAFALHERQFQPTHKAQLGWTLLGFILIIYAIFSFNEHTPYPSLYAAAPTVGTALLIIFAREGSFAHQILSNRWMVQVGLISYSAYLVHY